MAFIVKHFGSFNIVERMKRSILGLMYLIQGMRNAGIDVDTRLASIGIKLDAIDPNSIIHDSLEWDIQYVIGKMLRLKTDCLLGSIMHWQVMALY